MVGHTHIYIIYTHTHIYIYIYNIIYTDRSSIGDGGIGPQCAETTTQKKCAETTTRKKPGLTGNPKVKSQGQIGK